ncbi:protein kinase [Micromonospora terminaliae]|uniref:non-specific serine/threonine protein kinase n=1 Tax=Micromonospora terminaliae TaxID=1914461 RepID=A0AAJ2ZBH0_9ACTN|nr:serine/threonine-protein kinase [Micromonospora terminaliae]NES26947.1 protein kinase [Micromonospora terminaliae]QGL48271.1 protein kinase [Micromonospora terminaliae]
MQQVVIAGRYRLLDLVGRGGMGRVWLARDEMLHREVAVKQVVPPGWLAPHERDELRGRTLREARATARLTHPNVVRVYDVVRVDGDPWLVMEYVPSRSLQETVETDGPVDPRRAATIGLAVLAALRAAHEAGVLHRDVKPANVLLARDGRVLLTDFGLAVFDGGDGMTTRPGLVLGSPQYVAPERAAEGVSSVEADLWSLGATLHAAVEGRSPYARSTAMATLAALASQPPDPAPHAGPLAPVLVGLLRRDPRHRLGHDDAARLLAAATAPTVDVPGWPAAGTVAPATAPDGDDASGSGWDSGGATAVPPPERAYPDVMPPAAAAREWSRAARRSEWAPPDDEGTPPPAPSRAGRGGGSSRPAPAAADQPTPTDGPAGGVAIPGGTAGTSAASSGADGTATSTSGAAGAVEGGNGPAASPAGEAECPSRRRRAALRRLALAAAAVVLAVAAGIGTALAVTDDHDGGPAGDPHGEGPGEPWEHRPGPPGGPPPGVPPPPFPCVRPEATGNPVRAGSPPADAGLALPAGWVWHADSAGFRVAVPAGWLELRSGSTTCFQDPATRRILGVEPYPGGDPLGQLRAAERELTTDGRLPGYQKVRLAAAGGGAEWECRWTAPYGERMHALRVLPGDAGGWTLGWTTSDADWSAAAGQLALIRDSFRSGRATRAAG